VRVVIADDSAIVRDGLARVLADRGIDVCATASDADGALRSVAEELPDVVIVDIRMPPTFTDEGLRVADLVLADHPATGVLVLSQHVEAGYALRLVDGGQARAGYLLKDRITDVDVLVDALERVARGETVVDPQLVEELVSRRHGPLAELSPREREILALMAEGLTDRAIAQRLWVSEKTVETHVRHVLRKLRLPPDTTYNRRVRAVLAYLQAA